jgi:hypothetical protein
VRARRSSARIAAAIVVAAFLTAPLAVAATHDGASTLPAAKKKTKNLVKNPGAEEGSGSANGSVVHIPDWNPTGSTAVKYGATGGGGFPDAHTPGPPKRGANFFAGGPYGAESVETLSQTVALGTYATAVDAGHVSFTFNAWLGGTGSDGDSAVVYVVFYSASGQFLSSSTVGPVTHDQRKNVTKFLLKTGKGTVPKTARSVLVDVEFDGGNGTYNNAYADNLSLVLTGV